MFANRKPQQLIFVADMQRISEFFYARVCIGSRKTQRIFLLSSDEYQLLRLADIFCCYFATFSTVLQFLHKFLVNNILNPL